MGKRVKISDRETYSDYKIDKKAGTVTFKFSKEHLATERANTLLPESVPTSITFTAAALATHIEGMDKAGYPTPMAKGAFAQIKHALTR